MCCYVNLRKACFVRMWMNVERARRKVSGRETNASMCVGRAADCVRQLVLQSLVLTAELFIAKWCVAWLAKKPLFFCFISFSAIHFSLSLPLLAFLLISVPSLSCLCSFHPLPLCLAVKADGV